MNTPVSCSEKEFVRRCSDTFVRVDKWAPSGAVSGASVGNDTFSTMPLLRALRNIGRTPMDTQAVLWYQIRIEGLLYRIREAVDTLFLLMLGALALITFLTMAVLTLEYFHAVSPLILRCLPGMAVVSSVIFCAMVVICRWLSSQNAEKWETVPLRFYKGRIPAKVTKLASFIASEVPKVQFSIVYLKKDPFLKATLGREEYYICGWNLWFYKSLSRERPTYSSAFENDSRSES